MRLLTQYEANLLRDCVQPGENPWDDDVDDWGEFTHYEVFILDFQVRLGRAEHILTWPVGETQLFRLTELGLLALKIHETLNAAASVTGESQLPEAYWIIAHEGGAAITFRRCIHQALDVAEKHAAQTATAGGSVMVLRDGIVYAIVCSTRNAYSGEAALGELDKRCRAADTENAKTGRVLIPAAPNRGKHNRCECGAKSWSTMANDPCAFFCNECGTLAWLNSGGFRSRINVRWCSQCDLPAQRRRWVDVCKYIHYCDRCAPPGCEPRHTEAQKPVDVFLSKDEEEAVKHVGISFRAPEEVATSLRRQPGHCKRGHILDEANTYEWGGNRHCRTCTRERQRLTKQKKTAARVEARRNEWGSACHVGHAFDEKNTYMHKGRLHCRACRAQAQLRRNEKAKQGRAENKAPLPDHCGYGHPFTAENTYWWKGKHRKCRECRRLIQRAHCKKAEAA